MSRLLQSRKLEWGSVIIVDEAGQVSARQMVQLTRLALAKGARLILSGDTRQHGAVEATDALQLLETYAGVTSVRLREIRRQDPSRGATTAERQSIAKYREAVQAAADHRHDLSFDLLCESKRVHEVQGEDRIVAMMEAFEQALARRERTLVVSQTWDEVNWMNETMHAWLERQGQVTDVRPVVAYQNLNLTVGEKCDPTTYGTHRDIVFVRSYGRFAKGDRAEVVGGDEQGLRVCKDGKVTTVGLGKVDRFIAVEEQELEIGVGDRLQLKFNGTSAEGRKLSNGELVTVRRHGPDGSLVVCDDRGHLKTLTAEQRIFNLGYAVTSYGSQGKTVDTVLFSDSGRMGATNRKQWYVTISRGRKNVEVFTEDSRELRAAIMRDGDRAFAVQGQPFESPGIKLYGPVPTPEQEPSNYYDVVDDIRQKAAWRGQQQRRMGQARGFGHGHRR